MSYVTYHTYDARHLIEGLTRLGPQARRIFVRGRTYRFKITAIQRILIIFCAQERKKKWFKYNIKFLWKIFHLISWARTIYINSYLKRAMLSGILPLTINRYKIASNCTQACKRALEGILRALGGSWRSLGALLDALRTLLGRSWRPF